MSLANQVQTLENELYELKQNAGIEKNIIGKSLFKYKVVDETGYVLANNKSDAYDKVDIDDAKVTLILTNEQLMKLINNSIVVTYLLPF